MVGVNRVAARTSDGGDHDEADRDRDDTSADTAAHAEQAEALRARGADVVVDDLADLLADEPARRGGV
nr:hypothetical protein [Saccharomonospora saliphila]